MEIVMGQLLPAILVMIGLFLLWLLYRTIVDGMGSTWGTVAWVILGIVLISQTFWIAWFTYTTIPSFYL